MKHFNKLKHFLILLVASVAGYMPASAQLAGGVYTVGGTSPNYATITAAVSAMSAGITGPVTFNIRPGTYATPVAFTAITGASATNRVVFQAESGKGTVTVSAAGTSTTNNYVFRFSSANYITLRNLTLSNTGTTYGAAVDFVGTSSNDSVVGCLLTGSTGTSTSQYKARVYASGHTGTDIVIYQDSIISPSYGVYWYGSSTSALSNNTVIANNTIVNPYYSCVYTYYTNGLKVLNNNSPAVTGVGTFYAYYNGYGNNRIEVRGNTANASGSGSMYGLGVYYCAGDAVTPALRGNFSNNNITLNTTGGSVYPVYNYYSQYDSITNNTISAVTTYSSGYAYMYLAYNAPYSVILNNNIIDSSANYYAYNYGVYYAPYSVVKKNNIRQSAGGSGYFYNYPLYYSNYAVVDSNTFVYLKSGTSGYLYNNGGSGGYAYYSDYVSVSGNTMQHLLPSSSGYLYGGMFYYCNYGVCKNNNMVNYAGNTSSYLYGYWSYYGSNNTLDNNYIVDSCGYYTYLYNGYYSPNVTWSNNTHRMYSGTYYIYDYRNYYGAGGNRILNNNFYYTQGNSSYTTYNYMMYGVPNTQYVGNTVRANVAGAYYGYTYQGSASYSNAKFANNDISVTSTGGGTVYGLYFQYPNFDTIFNNVVNTATSGTNYTAYIYYPYGGLNYIYNNTFNSNATGGTNYTLYDYNPGSYSGTTKYTNNIISRMGSTGQAPFCMYSNAYVTASDYNNIYAPNTPLMTISSTGYNTISAIRTGTIYEKNSLSYNPGYVNAAGGDLHPDPNNPSAWSVNGRGIHIAGNNTDRSGAARSITPGTGVPDLGAYEFIPLSSPPACTAAPAAPVAGGTQVFTFGQDTAAVITWDATAPVPSAITVKQFSGAVAPTLTGFNATYMYFYDSIGVTGTGAFNYTVKNYYKDPWIGTIASESSLRLAKKDLAWVGYPATAGNSTVWNQFTTAGLSTYGLYTGIDVSNNASANSVAAPSGSFCPGTYPTSIRITNNGNNVINSVQLCWKINGGSTSCTTITAPIPVFNGTIGSNAINVPIGNILYGTGNVNIFAWTSMPNTVVDPANGDDTLNIDMHSALSGVYTVGGTTPDFTDVIAGVNALKTYGMCGPVTFKVRAGSYAGNIDLTNVSGSSAVNRFTMQADDNVPASSVNISYSATGSGDNYVVRLNGLNYVTLKNLTFNATGGSYGYCLTFAGAQNNYDSVIGCTFNTASISNSYFAGIYCYNLTTPNYLVIKNNTVNGGYYGMSFYSTTSNTPGLVIDSNTISNVYYYGINYIYYFDGAKVRYNNISTTSTSAYYGLYYFYCSGNTLPIEFIGNRISGFYGYGTLIYYPYGTATNRSVIRNNIITYNGTSTSYYQLFCGYSTYTDVINNTAINAGGASSSTSYCPGYIYFSSYTGSRAYNNLFANYSGGPAMYCYFYGGYSQACDYNNLYSSGSTLVYDAYNGTTYANLGTWRSSSFASTTLGGFDKNSISYNPGVNATTGVPNPADPGAWAVNGRGVQMLGNNKDINGAARPDVLAAGVPDVGAVEIDPTSIPPLATPTGPAVVGGKQYFLFGYDTVASVTWNPTLGITDSLEVRQYSGRKAPGFNLVSPTKFMYFYTDIKPRSTVSTFDYNTEVYYMAPWLGTMPVEANIKMAEKVGTTWVAYNGSNSATNVTRKFISAPGLAAFGAFTGIDDGTLFSALVKANGSTIICTGSKVTLKASTGTGYSYQWNKNGTPISGATQDSLVVTQAGDYSVTINAPAGTATSITMNVSTVAPPMSQITASGALTYCPGNNLTLMGNTGAGLSYQWQLNGLDIAGATAQNYAVSLAGTYTLKVKNIGCTTTSNATVVNAGPLVVDLGTDTTFCQTKYIPFILDAGVPGAKYQWSTGDTTQKISVSTQSGDYWVLVNAGANCVDADTIHLLVHPLPSVNAINSLPLGNNTYAFSPAGAQNINNVLWIFGDGTTSNNYTTQHTFPDGNINVRLVMYNDCGSDTAMILRWAASVGSTTNEGFDVKLYPNPASDKLTLTLDGNVYLKDVTILNSVGAVVYRSEVNDNAKQAIINVAPYANGQYIIRANTSEGAVSKPFNIVR